MIKPVVNHKPHKITPKILLNLFCMVFKREVATTAQGIVRIPASLAVCALMTHRMTVVLPLRPGKCQIMENDVIDINMKMILKAAAQSSYYHTIIILNHLSTLNPVKFHSYFLRSTVPACYIRCIVYFTGRSPTGGAP